MPRSASLGYSGGRGLGRFLEALLETKAQKDLLREKKLQKLAEGEKERGQIAGAEALASPLPDFLIKQPREQIARDILARADPEAFAKSFLEPEKPKTKPEMEAEMFKQDVYDNPENRQKYVINKWLGKKDEGLPPNVTGALDLTDLIKMRTGKTGKAQKEYDKRLEAIGETYAPGEGEEGLKATLKLQERLRRELGDRPADYIPENVAAMAGSTETARTDPEMAAALAFFEPLIKAKSAVAGYPDMDSQEDMINFPLAGEVETGKAVKTGRPKSFHGATSYKSAIAGLKKNYQAGLIPEDLYKKGVLEAKQFFGVK